MIKGNLRKHQSLINGSAKSTILYKFVQKNSKLCKNSKKIELSQEPKSTINTQILNEKNRLVNQSNIDTKPRGDDSNEYIDVEEEFQNQTNKSHLTDTSLVNNSLSRSNLSQSAVCQNLPDNLPADFVALITKFLDLYEHIITTNTESLPPDLKSILINIYTESKRVKQQSNVFNYLSHKTGRNKDSLFRVCRRILNKDTAPNQSNLAGTSSEFIQNLPAQNQPNKPHNFATPNLPVNLSMKAENDLKIKQSPPVSPQITFGDLSEELKTKIVNLKKEYLICKQKNELAKFLEKSHIQNWIYSVDISVRNSKSTNLSRLRDFCIGKLAESFDMSKERFQKDYQTIVAQMRTKSLENSLRNKISELKREVDAEMPKHFDKFSRLMDEYSKNKLNEKNEEARKKMNPPRKKFEFTEKIRDLILNIIQIKMSLFRICGSSPSPQNSQMDASAKLGYIDNFFETELLNLWPKNWMQKNVLLNFYQIKYCQQQQHMQHQRTSSLNHAVQRAPTSSSSKQASSSTINISSKNGKTVKIEPQAPSPIASQAASSKMNMPSTPKSINQQTQAINLSKQNVYDNVVSQHKKKTINQNMVPGVNSSQSEEFSPNPSRPSKSPQNLFQISNLIGSAGLANSPLPDLTKLQQQLNLMLPNLVQNSASLPNLSNSFSNNNPK
ncbi:ubinuclein-2-like isoform X1 [Brachionus plicatilis]|uniref:Ubinuclein-2-like isoform X1 n=1 Tax=Brachionus plicatilis TaxID=10195 RepID=A0A3M7SD03_BRAPC|nr:ubinuclein-2-like isoform X1 [Brachionus plicatilis]